jgi:hypothetical protein
LAIACFATFIRSLLTRRSFQHTANISRQVYGDKFHYTLIST